MHTKKHKILVTESASIVQTINQMQDEGVTVDYVIRNAGWTA